MHLPPVLAIVDARQTNEKRIKLLTQLLEHFNAKLPPGPQSERLLRMLTAARNN